MLGNAPGSGKNKKRNLPQNPNKSATARGHRREVEQVLCVGFLWKEGESKKENTQREEIQREKKKKREKEKGNRKSTGGKREHVCRKKRQRKEKERE